MNVNDLDQGMGGIKASRLAQNCSDDFPGREVGGN